MNEECAYPLMAAYICHDTGISMEGHTSQSNRTSLPEHILLHRSNAQALWTQDMVRRA